MGQHTSLEGGWHWGHRSGTTHVIARRLTLSAEEWKPTNNLGSADCFTRLRRMPSDCFAFLRQARNDDRKKSQKEMGWSNLGSVDCFTDCGECFQIASLSYVKLAMTIGKNQKETGWSNLGSVDCLTRLRRMLSACFALLRRARNDDRKDFPLLPNNLMLKI